MSSVSLSVCPFPVFSYLSALSLLLFSLHSPAVQVSRPFLLYIALTSKMSSFHTHTSLPLTLLLPLCIHHSLSLASPLPPLPPSRDNYYKPCEDQLVFKQLNKQGPGLLTVTIQQQSSETEEWKIIVCVQHYRGHLKTSPKE